jgi:predicted MFS family arabinose efflux permease
VKDLHLLLTKVSTGRFFVAALMIAYVSTWLIESLTGVFLIDITSTFFGTPNSVKIAVASQLVTISSIVSVVFGLFLGALSVKFSHKRLLIFGILCVTIGTLGCFLAPTFFFMQIFYPVEGIGTVAVSAMAFTLVGETLALNRRPKATGWVLAGGPIASIAAAFVISLFFSNAGGWRLFLLWFALPISTIALITVYFGIPSIRTATSNKIAYSSGFRLILRDKSSVSCLIANMVRQAALAWTVIFIASFFRDQFGLPLSGAALIVLGGTAVSAVGDIVGGHLVNTIGRKRLLIVTLTASSPFLALIAILPNFWTALAVSLCGIFIFNMGFPGSVNLTLEQAPKSRGTMMSLSTVFVTFGLGLGAAVGGAALAFFGSYTAAILVFVAFQLCAATIYYFFVKDPYRR